MSFAEVLSEIPRFTPEQRRELLRRVMELEHGALNQGDTFGAREVGNRTVLVSPRTIRQAEVDAILDEFP
jgi:hypothetical protein